MAMVAILSLSISFIVAPSVDAAGTTITYHADGTTNDVSGTHNGTWFGPAVYLAGYTGASADQAFGAGPIPGYIETDTTVGTFGTDSATIDFYFKSGFASNEQLWSVMSARSGCNNPSDGWFDIRVGRPTPNDPLGRMLVEFGDGPNYVNVVGQTNVMDNNWHHVIVTRGNTGVSINVDGAPDGNGASPAANVNPTVPFTIGHSPCTNGVDGTQGLGVFMSIDEINITRMPAGIGPPTNKDQCKNNGWATFTIPRKFKNQGDCIQYVNTGK